MRKIITFGLILSLICGLAFAESIKRDRVECSPMSASLNRLRPQSINTNIVYVKKNQTIQEAINLITDASATNPYTVIIPPGFYDEQILLADNIHIQGSGMDSTYISYDTPGAYWLESVLDFGATTTNIRISDLTMRKVETDEDHPLIADSIVTADSLGEFHRVRLICERTSGTGGCILAPGFRGSLKFYDCITWSTYDAFWQNPGAGNNCTLYFFNHYHEVSPAAAAANSPNIFVSLKNSRVTVYVFNSLISGISDRTGSEGPVGFKITDGTLRVYGTRIDLTNSADATITHGIATHGSATGADIEMYGCSIETNGGYDIYNEGDIAGIKLNGVKWATHYGDLRYLCQGTQRFGGKTFTATSALTFQADDGNVFIIDPGGSNRIFVPVGSFAPWTQIIVVNTADAAESITFESTTTTAGSHDGDDNAAILTDSARSWSSNRFVGKTLTNTTDASSGIITANTGTTVTAVLSGGAENDWDIGDNYTITPAPLNQAVAQNERGIFVYDGAGAWFKVYVGS